MLPLVAALQDNSDRVDVLIKDGRLVDGSGNPWIKADVAIKGDRIVGVGRLLGQNAGQIIDAERLVVAPGFIDMLGQSAYTLMEDGEAQSKVYQGVTTEIHGEGTSAAPINDRIWHSRKRDLVEPPWRTFDDYFQKLESGGISINVGTFLGAGTVRAAVTGDEKREPTEEELEQMKRIVEESMQAGAFGLASALIYPPGIYAGRRELVELSRVVSRYGGIYISHLRSEGYRLGEGIEELIEIGRQARLPVEIYHLKVLGKENWPRVQQIISIIEKARDEEVDITANMYPYVGASTGLDACIPPDAFADGRLQERLKIPQERQKIKERILRETSWENFYKMAGPEAMVFARIEHPYGHMIGKTLAQVAREENKEPVELLLDLIASTKDRIQMIYYLMNEDNVRLILKQPWVSIGSDAAALKVSGPLSSGKPHPRAYGTFPRILGRYVRDERVIGLEEAIRKMTSLPAQRLGLRDRGLLRAGMYADVVIFNPKEVNDVATFEAPHQYSKGIHYVFVNGSAVLAEGKQTGARPGRVLRHRP